MKPIQFSTDPNNFTVTYTSPNRDYGDLRAEFNNDAVKLKEKGPVFLAFSSGVDSQVILRSFLDMKVDFQCVFLHMHGVNEQDFTQLAYCKRFYGIDVRVIDLNVEEHKEEWILDNTKNNVNLISQYPFKYLSDSLTESYPMITQGAVEPCIVGSDEKNVSIYHNMYEAMELRFKIMNDRDIIDFPLSPESVASYYTDEALKTFATTFHYYNDNMDPTQTFNKNAKAFIKGKYYKNDILWFPKLTGYETAPNWLAQIDYVKTARVSVPYWELVTFLEKTRNETKTFKDWMYDK
jgi:hypothetical protein